MTRMEERELSLTQTSRLKAEARAMKYARIAKLVRDGMSNKEITTATGFSNSMIDMAKAAMKGAK